MKRALLTFFLTVTLIAFQSLSQAVIEAVVFDTVLEEQRYKNMIDELRCLVCQNQNLAGSDAPLAKDLRDITASMISQGASDGDIKEFMRSRYGDFVLYEPPFNLSTAFLWLGPFALLLIVLCGVLLKIRRRQEDEAFDITHAKNNAHQVKVRNLLRDTPSLNSNNDNATRPDKPE